MPVVIAFLRQAADAHGRSIVPAKLVTEARQKRSITLCLSVGARG